MYVWMGRGTSLQVRKGASEAAEVISYWPYVYEGSDYWKLIFFFHWYSPFNYSVMKQKGNIKAELGYSNTTFVKVHSFPSYK